MTGLLYPKPTPLLDKRQKRRDKDAHWRKVVAEVKHRDGGRCRNCYAVGTDPHHIVPRSLGGKDDVRNVCWLCRPCHDLCTDHYLRIEGGNANRTLRFVRSEWMR